MRTSFRDWLKLMQLLPRRICSAGTMICVAALLGACQSTEVHWNLIKMREHASDYYTQQIMDNLIRASRGTPFVHVDIVNLQSSVAATMTGTFSGGESVVDTGATASTASAMPGVVGTLTRAVTRPLGFTVTPGHNDTLTSLSSPEVNDSELYQQYMRFLKLPKVEGIRLQSARSFDPALPAKIQSICSVGKLSDLKDGVVDGTLTKWRDHRYYYIPSEFKQAYFDLGMALIGRIRGEGGGSSVTAAFPKQKNSHGSIAVPATPLHPSPSLSSGPAAGTLGPKPSSTNLLKTYENSIQPSTVNSLKPAGQ